MGFKKLFVPLTGLAGEADANPEAAALEAALNMGIGVDAHVEAYFCAPPSGPGEAILPAGLPGSAVEMLIAEIEKAIAAQRLAAKDLFESAMMRHQPPHRAEPDEAGAYSVAFVEETGALENRLAPRARLADLVVIGLGAGDRRVSRTLEICLRETGRPVLAVPPGCTEWQGQKIAIGWNGSAEAARVLSVSNDLLTQANHVTVISVDEDGPTDPGANQLVSTLAWHGVTADAITLEGSRDTAGPLLMERADSIGADLLIMGAYTRSRFSRLIFGSATSDVLAAASMPILMMH